MRYFYLPEENLVVRLDDDWHMWVYDNGDWVENYQYGGIFSGDIPCKEISASDIKEYVK